MQILNACTDNAPQEGENGRPEGSDSGDQPSPGSGLKCCSLSFTSRHWSESAGRSF